MKDIHSVSLVDRRGYLTVMVELEKEDNLMLRRSENVREWYNTLQRMVKESKTRVMESTDQFWAKKKIMDPEKMDDWLMARARIGTLYQYTSSPIDERGRQMRERPISAASMDRRQTGRRQRKRDQNGCRLIYNNNNIFHSKNNVTKFNFQILQECQVISPSHQVYLNQSTKLSPEAKVLVQAGLV